MRTAHPHPHTHRAPTHLRTHPPTIHPPAYPPIHPRTPRRDGGEPFDFQITGAGRSPEAAAFKARSAAGGGLSAAAAARVGALCVEFFCAAMASMLTLFSYHSCQPTEGVRTDWLVIPPSTQARIWGWVESSHKAKAGECTPSLKPIMPPLLLFPCPPLVQVHACSWMQDLEWGALPDVQRAALLANLLTLALWLCAAAAFTLRDQFIASAFDEDRSLACGNLPLVLKGYPSLAEKLRRHNFVAAAASGALAGLSLSNFALSMFALCSTEAYGGYKCGKCDCSCPNARRCATVLSFNCLRRARGVRHCVLRGLMSVGVGVGVGAAQDPAGRHRQPAAGGASPRVHGPVRTQFTRDPGQ